MVPSANMARTVRVDRGDVPSQMLYHYRDNEEVSEYNNDTEIAVLELGNGELEEVAIMMIYL